MVGFSTRMGSGCTSGHGICGIQILPAIICGNWPVMLAGFIAVYLVRHA